MNNASSGIVSRSGLRPAARALRDKPSLRSSKACFASAIISGCSWPSGSGVPNIRRNCSGRPQGQEIAPARDALRGSRRGWHLRSSRQSGCLWRSLPILAGVLLCSTGPGARSPTFHGRYHSPRRHCRRRRETEFSTAFRSSGLGHQVSCAAAILRLPRVHLCDHRSTCCLMLRD